MANQKYIITSILDLFGKDVQENFVAMLTFCDRKEPQIVQALKERGSIQCWPIFRTFGSLASFRPLIIAQQCSLLSPGP